jgi:hypothetical protein
MRPDRSPLCRPFLLALVLAGCAQTETVAVKPAATQQDFYLDSGDCRGKAYSAPGATDSADQVARAYNSCMQAKGWSFQQVPKRQSRGSGT